MKMNHLNKDIYNNMKELIYINYLILIKYNKDLILEIFMLNGK